MATRSTDRRPLNPSARFIVQGSNPWYTDGRDRHHSRRWAVWEHDQRPSKRLEYICNAILIGFGLAVAYLSAAHGWNW